MINTKSAFYASKSSFHKTGRRSEICSAQSNRSRMSNRSAGRIPSKPTTPAPIQNKQQVIDEEDEYY